MLRCENLEGNASGASTHQASTTQTDAFELVSPEDFTIRFFPEGLQE